MRGGLGGRRESVKKRFLCALETGLPLQLFLSALVFLRRVMPGCSSLSAAVPWCLLGKQRQEAVVLLVQNGAEGDLGFRNLHVIHGDI